MNSETVPILAAVIIQSALGLTVFLANPRRKSNQSFLLLSFSAVGWLAALYFGSTTTNLTIVTLCIREASAAGVLILATFNLLRLSIREPSETWGAILDRSRVWIALTVGMIGFCQTKFFLVGAQLVHRVGTTAPDPVYGHPGVYLYALWFAAAIIHPHRRGLSDGLHAAALIPAGILFWTVARDLVRAVPHYHLQSRTRVRHRHSKNFRGRLFPPARDGLRAPGCLSSRSLWVRVVAHVQRFCPAAAEQVDVISTHYRCAHCGFRDGACARTFSSPGRPAFRRYAAYRLPSDNEPGNGNFKIGHDPT